MKIKKGTDVYELTDASGDYQTLVPVDSFEGKDLTRALETLLGSPALDDYENTENDENEVITISRFKLSKNITLKNHD